MSFDDFAAREPYFAVLTDPKFLRANLTPEHEREFFASGEDVVSWMFSVIEAGLSPKFAPMTMLEYGCGLGRLALPLARRPGSVTAVDQSKVMLDLARQEAARRGLDHIQFQTPDELFATPRKFDLVVCYHVLQRLKPAEGVRLLGRLIDLVSPNGVGVFQWPFRGGESAAVEASRWIREHVPAANAVANALRGKPSSDPFIPTHIYKLDEMLQAFDSAGFRATHVVFEQQGDLRYTIVLAQKPERTHAAPSTRHAAPAPSTKHAAPSTAKDLDAYNRSAEQYFASLTDWHHHLAKPFSNIEEAPAILANVVTMLQGLKLVPGMTVLEFGAGSGWLSRYLTQLGCRVVLLDVSATALRIARELYGRQPVLGDQPAPEFLEFDGRRIALPDGSVERVVCFDAFHHAANPDDVIREFGRVLAPGGIAGFAEPGPRHSESPRSQFESHTYGVVEKDVDVHAIWRTARSCGFATLEMAVFHEPPYLVTLEEYEDLVAGGATQERWLASTRGFLHHVRNFFLTKAGVMPADSRRVAGLACEIQLGPASTSVVEGASIEIDATVRNTGTSRWLASSALYGGVLLGAHVYDATGTLVRFDAARAPLADPPRDIAPGEVVTSRLTLAPLPAGRYRIELDCVAARVTWFALAGSKPARVDLSVIPGNIPSS
jgi:2-polyprenyl-3-methyl-5-hydroxy-6-metoxy-1,4-benzoquinol methylase